MGKVLIIDDNDHVLTSTAMVLEMEGYDVVTSRDPFCTNLIIEEKPDLILLDVNMPMIQGDALGKVFAGASTLFGRMVILFHSNLPEEQLRQKAREAGVDGYIPKANDPAILSSQISSWMARTREKARP